MDFDITVYRPNNKRVSIFQGMNLRVKVSRKRRKERALRNLGSSSWFYTYRPIHISFICNEENFRIISRSQASLTWKFLHKNSAVPFTSDYVRVRLLERKYDLENAFYASPKTLYRKTNDSSVKKVRVYPLGRLCNVLSMDLAILAISYYRSTCSSRHTRLVISWLAIAICGRSNRSEHARVPCTILRFIVAFFPSSCI